MCAGVYLSTVPDTNTMCAGVYSSPRLLFYTGLRGAIAFALAIRNTSTEPRQIMVSATMMIVIVTVILGGGLTTPMLGWLQIRSDLSIKLLRDVTLAILLIIVYYILINLLLHYFEAGCIFSDTKF